MKEELIKSATLVMRCSKWCWGLNVKAMPVVDNTAAP